MTSQINRYHVEALTYFLEKLRETPDGDGTLLDHSMNLYGSALSDGNEHNFDPLPVVLIGGASGQVRGAATSGTRRRRRWRTWLTMLDKMGARVESIGDSTGRLEV